MRLLFLKGANLYRENKFGDTPIKTAITKGDLEMLQILLPEGSTINLPSDKYIMNLYYFAKIGKHNVFQFLLYRRANINAQNKWDSSCLKKAISDNDRNIETIIFICENGADVNIADNYGNTPVSYAAMIGNIEILRYLHSQGGNINTTNHEQNSPLCFAATNGDIESPRYLVANGAKN